MISHASCSFQYDSRKNHRKRIVSRESREFFWKKGIHPLVHLTACICRLENGDGADRDNENLNIAESTINMSLKQFNKLMIEEFGAQYLNRCRKSNV
jgi:hypothetical protein